jgi:hypothetical protein
MKIKKKIYDWYREKVCEQHKLIESLSDRLGTEKEAYTNLHKDWLHQCVEMQRLRSELHEMSHSNLTFIEERNKAIRDKADAVRLIRDLMHQQKETSDGQP